MNVGSDIFTVGSIVRAKWGSKRCRAMVATVGDSSIAADSKDVPDTLCILWEPIYPNLITEKFLITPKSIHRETEQDEAMVKVEMIENLLPFEINPYNGIDATTDIAMWKERGDQLLRLGDASTAASFYEKALSDSSSVSIGGTVIISVEGFPRIADVDCIDDDDVGGGGTIDVTILHNEDEKTIKQSAVLLSILEVDTTLLQERILLNLARCMLQLSQFDIANRPKYLKSAVLATTLVISLSLFQQQQQQQQQGADAESLLLPTNVQTALVLRCKAYIDLSKWSKATSDARKLLKRGSNEKQGRKLLDRIERRKKIRSKTDKKLAKEICLLVQSVTAVNESKTKIESNNCSRTSVSPKISASRVTTRQRRNTALPSKSKDNKRSNDTDEVYRKNSISCFQHQESFTNLSSLLTPSIVFGFSSAFFVVTLVTIVISVLRTMVNNNT